MTSSRRAIIITGAPGSGKTAILHELIASRFVGIPEAAREVLAEQRASSGRGVPETDPARFCQLMLDRTVADLATVDGSGPPAFFDRGIPDQIGYAELFGLDTSAAERAARSNRYDDTAFVTPSWPEIYTTDDERKMSLEAADAFGARLRQIFDALGYQLVELPRDSACARADFILDAVRHLAVDG